MFWQQMWFLTNMVFVAMLIVLLFVHRAVTLARLQKDAERIKRSVRVRTIIGIIVVLAFIAMAVFFLINMRVNR
ncbi:hypothetical protein Back11_24890 [Paenibacillus baekrokdamisoli]|uniref:Uncharacterized protein n=1 Tax=Paenibacillus baekrokdamisoli TaxID=1712516 RepID=A0A3G9JD53_9BACL|nr:hypothetical protein [Paenibacillus baekrokdamisoli]MBB3070133.1 amino acid transporter [Paenibacillus baekrokdamisoli]BBH21144.1 hypothetical protein Back11_24890 [Paenibacillus baekrokdamisoli]